MRLVSSLYLAPSKYVVIGMTAPRWLSGGSATELSAAGAWKEGPLPLMGELYSQVWRESRAITSPVHLDHARALAQRDLGPRPPMTGVFHAGSCDVPAEVAGSTVATPCTPLR